MENSSRCDNVTVDPFSSVKDARASELIERYVSVVVRRLCGKRVPTEDYEQNVHLSLCERLGCHNYEALVSFRIKRLDSPELGEYGFSMEVLRAAVREHVERPIWASKKRQQRLAKKGLFATPVSISESDQLCVPVPDISWLELEKAFEAATKSLPEIQIRILAELRKGEIPKKIWTKMDISRATFYRHLQNITNTLEGVHLE